MRDKLTASFIEGSLAGVVSSAADLIMAGWLKFGHIRYLDFVCVHLKEKREEEPEDQRGPRG